MKLDSPAIFLRGKKLRIFFQLLGVIIFVLVLSRVDLSEVARYFGHLDFYNGLMIVSILAAFTLVKGLRWRQLVAAQGIRVSRLRSFSIYSAGLYLGIITPGRVGDFIKSLYLINRGHPVGKALFSSFADRMLDLIFLVSIGYVSLLFFPGIFDNQYLLSTLIFALTAVIAALVFWRRDLLLGGIRRLTSLFLPSKIVDRTDRTISDMLGEFRILEASSIVIVLLLTIAGWFLHYLVFFIFARALSIAIPVPLLVASISAAIFMAILPVSLSGLGTRELVLIMIFGRIGLSNEAAVAFSFSFILVYIIQSFIGLICWLTGPFRSKEMSII